MTVKTKKTHKNLYQISTNEPKITISDCVLSDARASELLSQELLLILSVMNSSALSVLLT